MGPEVFFYAVLLLGAFAVIDLIVGVANDAVNFLNSAIGARAAPRHVIMIVASLGILAGVTYSSGMMEVARKGIFNPQFFTMPDLMILFLAVMLADILLLDIFNTYGLPTSTTVSIVFDLLGAALTVSVLKILRADDSFSTLAQYINTAKAMAIIGGILLSVAVAFVVGALAQFLTRLLFTFEYGRRLKRYGAIWGGAAMAAITYFIFVKGATGVSFFGEDTAKWIETHTWSILLGMSVASAVVLQIMISASMNILKPIVLAGTFALAMAFAANDLVNFIGVPIAGLHAYHAGMAADAPLTAPMSALAAKVPTPTLLLLLAGSVMVATLWVSRKARTVTDTEIRLSRQEEGVERFESSMLARLIVRMALGISASLKRLIPGSFLDWIERRFDTSHYEARVGEDHRSSFDMLRAAVNLVVSAALISYATSQKLPLSTTYVTFMVAMGSSFADRSWGRESAVYRITGVLTVVGGWFFTAIMALTISAVFAVVVFYGHALGVAALLAILALAFWVNHHAHAEQVKASEKEEVFNLRKVTDVNAAVSTTFEHMAHLLREIRESLDAALEALFEQNEYVLRAERNNSKEIQRWANIITANVFKAMRLMQKDDSHLSFKYGQTVRRLQKLSDAHRDITLRAWHHVSNHHQGLREVQVDELRGVKRILHDILADVESTFNRRQIADFEAVAARVADLRDLAETLHRRQMERIRDHESKTRLSILYYAILGNAVVISKQNLRLLEIFAESFGHPEPATAAFDLD